MNSLNPQNKLLGIALGIIVIGSVSYITMFSQRNDSSSTSRSMYGDAMVPSDTNNVSTKATILNRDDEEDEDDNAQQIQTPPPVITTKPTTKSSISVYKDGTYSAIGSYMSPGGPNKIKITVTLASDIITNASGVNMAGDERSVKYEDRFLSGFESLVVGKKISEVFLTKVSGASLTPKGFNDAINQIKASAKA